MIIWLRVASRRNGSSRLHWMTIPSSSTATLRNCLNSSAQKSPQKKHITFSLMRCSMPLPRMNWKILIPSGCITCWTAFCGFATWIYMWPAATQRCWQRMFWPFSVDVVMKFVSIQSRSRNTMPPLAETSLMHTKSTLCMAGCRWFYQEKQTLIRWHICKAFLRRYTSRILLNDMTSLFRMCLRNWLTIYVRPSVRLPMPGRLLIPWER